MALELLTARSEDVALLAEMNFCLIRDENHSNPMTLTALEIRMLSWLKEGYQCRLLYQNDNCVGYVLWRDEVEHLYIRHFFIKQEFRQCGIGTTAINLLKQSEWLDRSIRLDVLASNPVGTKFWNSLGFKEYCRTLEIKAE